MRNLLLICVLLSFAGCTNVLTVLDGATHACGTLHVEGFATDSQGEIVVVKAPADWTPEQIQGFCSVTR